MILPTVPLVCTIDITTVIIVCDVITVIYVFIVYIVILICICYRSAVCICAAIAVMIITFGIIYTVILCCVISNNIIIPMALLLKPLYLQSKFVVPACFITCVMLDVSLPIFAVWSANWAIA
jgi:hypothetical protein